MSATVISQVVIDVKSKGVGKVNKDIGGLANKAGKIGLVTKSLGKMRMALAALSNPITAAVAAVALLTVGVGVMVTRFLDAADASAKLARNMGMDVDQLTQFGIVAEKAGVKVEDIGKAIQTLQRRTAKAAEGNKEYARDFEQLGISIENFKNLRPDEQFLTMQKALSEVSNEGERLRIIQTLLGDQAAKLGSVFATSNADIQKQITLTRELGLVMSKDLADSAERINDNFTDVSKGLGSIFNTIEESILTVVLPLVESMSEVLGETSLEIGKSFRSWAVELGLVEDQLEQTFNVIETNGANATTTVKTTEEAIKKLSATLEANKRKAADAAEQLQAFSEGGQEALTNRVRLQTIHNELAAAGIEHLMVANEQLGIENTLQARIGEELVKRVKSEQALADKKKEVGLATAAQKKQESELAAQQQRGLQTLSQGMTDFLLNGKDGLANFAKQLTQTIIQAQILRVLTATVPGLGAALGGVTAAANGMAINGGVQAFAKGGVVSSPTVFPMAKGAGLMGEAGPEAIMPLKRGAGGKLGVAASGGGGGMTVNNVINIGKADDPTETGNQVQMGMERAMKNSMAQTMQNEKRYGGVLQPRNVLSSF